MKKLYYWFWHDLMGLPKPISDIIRGNYHNHPMWWIFGLLALGSFIGHLFW